MYVHTKGMVHVQLEGNLMHGAGSLQEASIMCYKLVRVAVTFPKLITYVSGKTKYLSVATHGLIASVGS